MRQTHNVPPVPTLEDPPLEGATVSIRLPTHGYTVGNCRFVLFIAPTFGSLRHFLHLAALGVNLLNHFFPSGNLSSGMIARSSGITLASRGNLSSLRDDQIAA